MKSLLSISMAACLAMSAGYAAAQDASTTNAPATRAATKMDAKKDMATSDCVENTNQMKGQKRTDPGTAETMAKCQDKKNMHRPAGDAMKSSHDSNSSGSMK